MGFVTFHKKYYFDFINEIENNKPTKERIYLTKQLLKLADDTEDEGYTDLNDILEEFNGRQKLTDYILNNNEKPFKLIPSNYKEIDYGKPVELNSFLNKLTNKRTNNQDNLLINELIDFTNSIKVDDDTAYIFLLRDTLIPYLVFKNRGINNIYPYLIGRKMLEDISGIKNVDDRIRGTIFDALEKGIDNYNDFINYVIREINLKLQELPSIENTIKPLLDCIKCKKIMVIESGEYGTIPLLLKALDSRIDFKMYTTVPYLKRIYKDKIFTEEFEKIREFETLVCQDKYFIYNNYKDGNFYVKVAQDENIKNNAISEISEILNKQNTR